MFALRRADMGITVAEVCRKMGISEATHYNWKKKYGDLGVPELRRPRQLGEDNQHLEQLVADLSLDKQALQDGLKKILKPGLQPGPARSTFYGIPRATQGAYVRPAAPRSGQPS